MGSLWILIELGNDDMIISAIFTAYLLNYALIHVMCIVKIFN